MRFKWLFYYLGLFICSLHFSTCKTTTTASGTKGNRPPNLVLILADDLGYADVGFNGCTDIPTPNIDRIANMGVTFTDGYVTWAACGPSRAGILTGRYQDRFGFARNPLFAPNDSTMGLPLSEQTLAEALHLADYKSAAIGKWHLGAHQSQRPLVRGFDDFFGFLTGGHRYFPEEWTLADEYEVTSQYEAYKTKLLRNTERVEETEYLTDALSREAVHYIQKYKDDPFFIYLAYNAPHAPLQATEKYLKRFEHIQDKKRKTYAAMVSAVDDGVGRVLDQLAALGLDDNTIVVFLSDNGGPIQANASDNGPLRGKKGQLFEGGIRVPFAMSWPGKIPSGIKYEKAVLSLDIFATIIAQSDRKIPLKHALDGVNLLPFLTGEQTGLPHEMLAWRVFDRKETAIRFGDNKLIQYPDKTELFDLKGDLGEQKNEAKTKKDLAQKMQQKRQEWLSEMKDAVFLGLAFDEAYNQQHPDRFKRPEKK
ncbi:MAG: sulfatase-like hydrolase/transferase [Saprospiraceae bacterium]